MSIIYIINIYLTLHLIEITFAVLRQKFSLTVQSMFVVLEAPGVQYNAFSYGNILSQNVAIVQLFIQILLLLLFHRLLFF